MADNYLTQIQDRFRSIHSLVHDINEEHSKNVGTISTLNKIHEKARQDEKITNPSKVIFENLLCATFLSPIFLIFELDS